MKTGVRPGSEFHLTEYFGPVLGIMTVDTLDQAIAAQNATDYGLTAGLHSLEPTEIAQWTASVEAGNMYVNRGITGAIVRRQPFGGWKRSAVGAGTKAGGPNYLVGLCDWVREPASSGFAGVLGSAGVSGAAGQISDDVAALLDTVRSEAAGLGLGKADLEFLDRAAASDAAAWASEFGVMRDVSGLVVERNEFRYVPTLEPVLIRVGTDAPVADVLRVVLAGVAARGRFEVSLAGVNDALARVLSGSGIATSSATAMSTAVHVGGRRVRLVGVLRAKAVQAVGNRPDVALYAQPVTEAGRIEMLPFLLEQAISMTNHRFGTVYREHASPRLGLPQQQV